MAFSKTGLVSFIDSEHVISQQLGRSAICSLIFNKHRDYDKWICQTEHAYV